MKKYQSSSSGQTKKLGFDLAKKILKMKSQKKAVVLALSGNLGSGKTTFIQGFFKGLGVRKKITSPTFLLIKRFPLRGAAFKNIFHIDAYRLANPKALKKLGFEEMTNSPSNIILIEWAEKMKSILPSKIIWLKFDYGKKPTARNIQISL
jgi:tRNA threonylcarbamoyladenosine biosynthesis protein TsaE